MPIRLDYFVEKAIESGSFAFDIEHPPEKGPSDEGFRLAGCSFATEDMVFYKKEISGVEYICDKLFARDDVEAIAYNGKYDMKCLVAAGLITSYQYPKNFVDPMVAMNLLDDNRRPNELGLDKVVGDLFGVKMDSFKEAWGYGEHSKFFESYACQDAEQEYKLWKHLKPKLASEDLDNLFYKILMPVSKVFADMELVGLKWDISGSRRLLRGFQKLRRQMQKEIKEEIGELNLDSGDQLAKRLFDEMSFSTRGINLTNSGKRLSVDKDAMDVLAVKYPVCKKIRTYRTSNKMINTYVEPMTRRAMDDPKDRIHPSFWIVSTTGRTRCEKPNFQNIPKKLDDELKELDIRKNVIADEGKILLVVDYSQIELRLIAHVSQDPVFLKAYKEWVCVECGDIGESIKILHKCPNCGALEDESALDGSKGFWHGLDIHQMTTDSIPALDGDRKSGKQGNFAIVYGASAVKMNQTYPQLSKNKWQKVIDQFFERYSGVKAWHKKMEKLMYESGVYTDIFGRKRRILRSEIRKSSRHAFNQFVNFNPQSSACGMLELSMARLREEWVKSKVWLEEIVMINMVHDEIIFEVDEDKVSNHLNTIVETMENVVQLRVPVRVDVKISKNWDVKDD